MVSGPVNYRYILLYECVTFLATPTLAHVISIIHTNMLCYFTTVSANDVRTTAIKKWMFHLTCGTPISDAALELLHFCIYEYCQQVSEIKYEKVAVEF